MPGIENVVVLPPVVHAGRRTRALVIRRGDVAGELEHPLRLPGRPVSVTPRDAQPLARESDRFLFHFEVGRVDNRFAFVVNPLGLTDGPLG